MTREEWLKEMEDQYGKSTLEDMINVRVVEQLAKKNKLKISKSEVDREFLLIKAVNNPFTKMNIRRRKSGKTKFVIISSLRIC